MTALFSHKYHHAGSITAIHFLTLAQGFSDHLELLQAQGQNFVIRLQSK